MSESDSESASRAHGTGWFGPEHETLVGALAAESSDKFSAHSEFGARPHDRLCDMVVGASCINVKGHTKSCFMLPKDYEKEEDVSHYITQLVSQDDFDITHSDMINPSDIKFFPPKDTIGFKVTLRGGTWSWKVDVLRLRPRRLVVGARPSREAGERWGRTRVPYPPFGRAGGQNS